MLFRSNPAVESISLDYDEESGDLTVLDVNLNWYNLPYQVGTELKKKVFLTYNGYNCETSLLTETVVLESGDGADLGQLPGYNNSNEWIYSPADFRLPTTLLTMTNPNDWSTYPYDVRHGFTIEKTFLTALGTAITTDATYTAFHTYPNMTQYQPSNVEGNKVYTDGWYTSYVIGCKTWASSAPDINGAGQGEIIFYEPNETYYINITGTGGFITTDPVDGSTYPDIVNWRPSPSFAEWMDLMRQYVGNPPAVVDQPIFFIESQHLVTADLNKAILKELKQLCSVCVEPTFGMTHVDDWMRLTQKRLGAWTMFSNELWVDAQVILESARNLCYICLYHKTDCLIKSNK